MKTYTTRSNANRAAKTLQARFSSIVSEAGIIPMGEGFAVTLVLNCSQAPEQLTPEMAVITVKVEDLPEHNDCRVPVVGEFTHCPHCKIDLMNGYQTIDNMAADGFDTKDFTHEYTCLACGGFFGPEVILKPEPEPETTHIVLNKSSVANPCKRVWDIAEKMHKDRPGIKRAEVLEACVEAGIAYYTARTQYQAWLAACKEMKAREAAQAKK